MANARQFFEGMLKPAYADWMGEPLVEHRAKAAVGYANDMAERVFEQLGLASNYPGGRGTADYRDDIARRLPDFGLVRDIADNTKHWSIGRANRRVSRADQTGPKSLAGKTELVVTLDDGTERSLQQIVQNVIDFWEAELK